MPFFRKRPVVVEAVHWHGPLEILTLEGVMRGTTSPHGNYLVRGIDGEFYPCEASIFERTYEPAVPLD